jgi:aminoglycoside phosphotransferase (APT) family kinase protein
VPWPAAIAAVAEALGWRLVRRCTGGEFGATVVEDDHGGRAILKAVPDAAPWSDTPWGASIGLVDRLRATGYPAPRYLASGTVAGHRYTLQEELAGSVPDRIDVDYMQQLLALAERHAGMGGGLRAAGVPAWSGWVHGALAGTYRPARRAVMRASHPEAARLADEVEALGRRVRRLVVPSGDVVHGDFHHRNMLAERGRVTAVIDWEQTTPGDWRYDVVWLAFCCQIDSRRIDPTAAELSRARVDLLLTPAEQAVYAGLVAIRILDLFAQLWPARLPRAIGWCKSHLAPQWR